MLTQCRLLCPKKSAMPRGEAPCREARLRRHAEVHADPTLYQTLSARSRLCARRDRGLSLGGVAFAESERCVERRHRTNFPEIVDDGISDLSLQRKLLYASPFSSLQRKSLVSPVNIFELEPCYFRTTQTVYSSQKKNRFCAILRPIEAVQ